MIQIEDTCVFVGENLRSKNLVLKSYKAQYKAPQCLLWCAYKGPNTRPVSKSNLTCREFSDAKKNIWQT